MIFIWPAPHTRSNARSGRGVIFEQREPPVSRVWHPPQVALLLQAVARIRRASGPAKQRATAQCEGPCEDTPTGRDSRVHTGGWAEASAHQSAHQCTPAGATFNRIGLAPSPTAQRGALVQHLSRGGIRAGRARGVRTCNARLDLASGHLILRAPHNMTQSGGSEIDRCPAGHVWERQALQRSSAVCPLCGGPAITDPPEPEDEQDYDGYGPH